jgi:RHS repeat-associated protein
MTYNYSATQNNGRIVSSADAVTGENVSYTYDSLNRLIAAATTGTGGVQWNESYSFDGFGNLTSKVSSKGTPASPQVDPTTNRARVINDYGFDANGNWLGVPGPLTNIVNTWNVENQLISNGAVDGSGNLLTYTYDPWGKRVLQYSVCARGSQGSGTLYFYGITGQRLGSYQLNDYPPAYGGIIALTPMYIPQYFGKRMLVAMDRLGSVRNGQNGSMAYFPWGEEELQSNGQTTPNGTDKFATYFRDGVTDGVGQDYANARYYNYNFGRFWSPDPGGIKTADAANPQSWNRYAYVVADPVNFRDPTGLDDEAPDGGCDSDEDCDPNGDGTGDGGGGGGGGGSGAPTPPDPTPQPAAQAGVPVFTVTVTGLPLVTPVPSPVSTTLVNTVVDGVAGVVERIGSVAGAGLLFIMSQVLTSSTSATDTLSSQGILPSPCVPPEGTLCVGPPDTGRPHAGLSPHYHVWQMQRKISTDNSCFWARLPGQVGRGVFAQPPAGMPSCSSFPSWTPR